MRGGDWLPIDLSPLPFQACLKRGAEHLVKGRFGAFSATPHLAFEASGRSSHWDLRNSRFDSTESHN